MKKKWIKRAIGAGLALTLSLGGLTACGSSGIDKEKNALAKENVYSFQEFNMPDLGADYVSMQSTFRADGRVYIVMTVEYYDENTGYRNEWHLISFAEDGSDMQNMVMEVNETVLTDEELLGDTPSDEDVAIDADYAVPEVQPREPEEELAEEEIESESEADEDVDADSESLTEDDLIIDDDMAIDDDMGMDDDMAIDDGFWVEEPVWDADDFWENTYLNSFTCGGDAIYGIRSYYYSNYSNGFSVSKEYLCCWNLDGSIRWESELEDYSTDEEYLWIQTMGASPDGSLNILLSGEAAYILPVSADGKVGAKRAVSDELYDVINGYWMLQPTAEGKFFVVYYGQDDWTKQYATVYDPGTDEISEPVEIPGTILYGYNSMRAGSTSDLIYTTSTGVFSYNMGDEEGTKLMDFVNSDLNITSLRDVIQLDETHFIGIFNENYDYNNIKAGLFTYVPPEDIPDKRVMVLAGVYIDYRVRQRVVEFNRNSQDYRITIKDYSQYNSYGDYEAGQNQLSTDIISGNMPDILIPNSNLPVENYISKGWIADINKLIKDDEELSQEEFLQNVFDAFSVDGKLYYVIPSFYVQTFVGKASILGDRTSWTMNDMIELANSLPEGTNMMEGITRGYFINMALMYCEGEFVDVETGKCSFDSEAFIQLMEYANTLPEEYEYPDDYWMHYESQYREDRTVLMGAYISSLKNFNYSLNGYFGEPVSYIGFPSSTGNGAILGYDQAYCIAAKSPNKDGAWQFLRYYLTDEYQESNEMYSMPVQKDAFEARAQEATERPYWIDSQTGEKEYYDDYFYMNGESIKLDPMSQEQVDQLVNYIYTVDTAYYYNSDVMNIIEEEIEAYFSGQKTAQEVADIIQRRVQVYVDENR